MVFIYLLKDSWGFSTDDLDCLEGSPSSSTKKHGNFSTVLRISQTPHPSTLLDDWNAWRFLVFRLLGLVKDDMYIYIYVESIWFYVAEDSHSHSCCMWLYHVMLQASHFWSRGTRIHSGSIWGYYEMLKQNMFLNEHVVKQMMLTSWFISDKPCEETLNNSLYC